MRDGDGEGEKDGEQREMSHVFHVERAGGEADTGTQRAGSSMFVGGCLNVYVRVYVCVCVFGCVHVPV